MVILIMVTEAEGALRGGVRRDHVESRGTGRDVDGEGDCTVGKYA
jgi:hypothetical protein